LPKGDYPDHFAAFHRFAPDVYRHLDEMGITEAMRPNWEPVMSERLFKMRTADKYLMLLGGFPVEQMENA